MVRQPRSEATRRKIINAAVESFDDVGYASAGLGEIIERLDVTKGALYHHFDSKEALAFAVIEEAMSRIDTTLHRVPQSSSSLESLIQASFASAELTSTDKLVRTGVHLLFTFAKFNGEIAGYYRAWLDRTVTRVAKAQAEGDVRPDLAPEAIGEVIVGALVGADVIATSVAGGRDLVDRAIHLWEALLPTLVTDQNLSYFSEFVARVSSLHLAAMPRPIG